MIMILPFVLYYFLILVFWFSWRKLKTVPTAYDKGKVALSVIVPFKDEEANLPVLIKALQQQRLPENNFEVLFIDDHSTDNSVDVIKKYYRLNNYKILRNQGYGKKQAILTGINNSAYQWIVQTDADCEPTSTWLETITLHLDKDIQMLLLPVLLKYDKQGFNIQMFDILEFISLQASTAATAAMNLPIMANAANLVYRKNLLLNNMDVLKTKIVSGDDIFLLHYAKKNGKVKFLKNRNAVVWTEANKNFKQFVKQRIRWTSKSKYYRDWFTIFVAFVVLLVNIDVLYIFFMFLMHYIAWKALSLIFIKFIVDFLLLFSFCRYFGCIQILKFYPFVALFYPFYIVIFGILGHFLNYRWK